MNLVSSQANMATSEKLSSKLFLNKWIIDSGASHHMTWKLDSMFNVKDIHSQPITLPNGKIAFAQKSGKSKLGKYQILEDVL